MAEPFGNPILFLQNLFKDPDNLNLSTYLKKFKKLKTNVQRMNFVCKDVECPSFKNDVKNDEDAIKHRERGNDLYKEGKYREALDCYTMSILNAKSKGQLALAFANRSAALFKLNLHQECLTDIDRAFENDYPAKLKPKLIARQKSSKSENMVGNKYYKPVPKFPESEKNHQIQNARNCVKITKNEQYGRCVVATRNIEIGEILAIEPPYSALVKEEIYIHCHECFELCYNMIPCGSCTKALYCSVTCKDKAFSSYHKYECRILLTLDFISVDNPKRLALKTILLSKDEWDRSDGETELRESDQDFYRSDRFKEIYEMESHLNERKAENLLSRTLIACKLFYLIKTHTTFLQECASEERFKDVLLSTILICGINTVDINELCPQFKVSSTATAVYSFFTIFSHSCWANVSRHFHGSTMVLRASNTIKKGQQCFVCYGPNYVSYSKEYRQNFLAENQFFTCRCRACEENWPMKDYMNDCMKFYLEASDALYFFTVMEVVIANVDQAEKEIQQLLVKAKKAERNWPPGRDYLVKDLLAFCYNILGNKRRLSSQL